MHLGRIKNKSGRSIRLIKRSFKSFQKEDWFEEGENSQFITLYFASFLLVDDFKNNRLQALLDKAFELIEDNKTDLSNPVFADFFKFFFGYSLRQYFTTMPSRSYKEGREISYSAFRKELAIVKNIENDTIRQLATLAAIDGYYHSFHFNREANKAVNFQILKSIKENSCGRLVEEYAEKLDEELSKLKIGEDVPEFTLIDYYGDSVNLSDLYGKYIYLDFWFSRCRPCISAMRKLPEIIDQYQDRVTFVSINSYDSFDLGKKTVEDNQFVGIHLHAAKVHPLLREYNVQYYPTYYFISPKGKLLYQPVEYYHKELDQILRFLE